MDKVLISQAIKVKGGIWLRQFRRLMFCACRAGIESCCRDYLSKKK